jgi:hypothetical protein
VSVTHPQELAALHVQRGQAADVGVESHRRGRFQALLEAASDGRIAVRQVVHGHQAIDLSARRRVQQAGELLVGVAYDVGLVATDEGGCVDIAADRRAVRSTGADDAGHA